MSHGYWLKNTARLAGGALLIGSVSLALGGPAAADVTALHGANGDNGSVKVHDTGTDAKTRKNEPQVCEFYLVGHKFDSAQDISWKIKEWPPTGKKEVVESGGLILDDEGNGRTEDMTLPDGHYKLFWTFEGENGKAKHKAFWVDCEDDATTPPGKVEPTPSPDDGESTPPPEDGESTPPPDDGETTTPPDDGESPPPPEDGESTPPADDGKTPDSGEESGTPDAGDAAPPADDDGLPVTGAALTGLVAAGVVAVAGGGTAVYFGRKKKAGHAGE